MFHELVSNLLFGVGSSYLPVGAGALFLPASRSGLCLTLPAVARQLIGGLRRTERDPTAGLALTSPVIEFLRWLATVKSDEKPGLFHDETRLLQNALEGRVEAAATGAVSELRYHPSGAKSWLPLHLSSSMVNEVAPLILALDRAHTRTLILEEPEAFLHPRLQRVLARVIARAVGKGLHVWITTHSADFCQQINNFIKLGALRDARRKQMQRELGYDEHDALDKEKVAGYELVVDDGLSTVRELEKSDRGIAMPTFNKELRSLSDETLKLQGALADGES